MTKSKVVEITLANAMKAYREAPSEFKPTLEKLIGKDVLNANIMDRVKSLEDALELVAVSDEVAQILAYKGSDPRMIAIRDQTAVEVIIEALNEGWVPNWADRNESKYLPWFEFRGGSGWAYGGYVGWRTRTACGSRLFLRTRELAEYMGKQFLPLYTSFLTLNK